MRTSLRLLILVLVLLFGRQQLSRAQVFQWVRQTRDLTTATTGITESFVPVSTTDADGATYMALAYDDSLRVGTTPVSGSGQYKFALVKYTPQGQLQWVQRLDGVTISSMAPDNVNGGVFLSGTISSSSTWNGSPVNTPGGYFYGRCSASGALSWTTILGFQSEGLKLSTDNLGNCYVLGMPSSQGPPTVILGTTIASDHAFLCQVSSTGTVSWVRQLHGPANPPGGLGIYFIGIGPKPGGGCLVFGSFKIRAYFGLGTSSTVPQLAGSGANQDAFLANYDENGNLLWSALGASTPLSGGARFLAAAADATGNCYVSGGDNWPITVGGLRMPGAGILVAKLNATGTVQWVRGQQSGNAYDRARLLAVDPVSNGVSVIVDSNTGALAGYTPAVLGAVSTASPQAVVHYNASGQEQWVVNHTYGPVQQFTATSYGYQGYAPFSLNYDAQGSLYSVGKVRGKKQPVLTSLFGSQTAVGMGYLATKLRAQPNTLTGQVYLDENGNGLRESTETAFPQPLTARVIQGADTAYYPVSATGELQALARAGSYALSLSHVPSHYTVTQPATGTYTGSFPGQDQRVTGQVFGVAPQANQPDVRVTLTPYGNVRAGFPSKYRLTLENVGTTTVGGTVAATLDSRMQYVGSTPAGSMSGGTLSWSYANLAPFGRLTFDVQFSLPVNVALGTVLTSTAAAPLTGDVAPADNSTTTAQTVTGSFDPNDITVNYSQLTTQQLADRLPLDYTIRFQNMGTDTAFTVVLQDTLMRSRLQLGTLQLVAQSHNCTWMLGQNGILTVRLINAKLPPRLTNTIASQGFVRFRVLPMASLQPGVTIPNHAHITFDYNAPLRTNTATTTVLLPTATRPGQVALSWDAYPNPVTDALTIQLPAGTSATAELLDALGRPVRQQPLTGSTATLDLRPLPAGLYLLRLRTPQGYTASRNIIRQ